MEIIRSVLIIDDEVSLRELCHIFLRENYTHIYLAENALSGLEKLKKNKVDVVLVDVNMPQMNGFEFIEEAKKKHPAIKFILMSGNVSTLNLHRAIKAGVIDFIEKPFSRTTLLEKVEDAFKQDFHFYTPHSLKTAIGEIHREKTIDRKALLIELRDEITEKFNYSGDNLDSLKNEIEQLLNQKINADKSDLIYFLTPTEQKISEMLDAGFSARRISKKTDRSINTIQVHIRSIRKKLGLVKSQKTIEV